MYISKNLVATTTEQNIRINIDKLIMLTNDSETADLLFTVDSPIASTADCYVLKPGEDASDYLKGMRIRCLYYKSSTGNVPFRIWG